MFGTWVLGWDFHSRLDVDRIEARFFSVVEGRVPHVPQFGTWVWGCSDLRFDSSFPEK
jgi:hypothetical protein